MQCRYPSFAVSMRRPSAIQSGSQPRRTVCRIWSSVALRSLLRGWVEAGQVMGLEGSEASSRSLSLGETLGLCKYGRIRVHRRQPAHDQG